MLAPVLATSVVGLDAGATGIVAAESAPKPFPMPAVLGVTRKK